MRYAGAVLLLLVAGIAARLGYVLFVHPPAMSVYSDMANYVQIADDIVQGVWRLSHFFQPLGYPLLLAGLKTVSTDWMYLLGWVHIAASGLTLALVWRVSTLSFGRRVGLLSLGVAALHLPWIIYAGFALSETLFTLLLAVLALCSWRVATKLRTVDAALWGAVFFLALLLKGTHIFVVVFFLLGLLLWKARRSWKAAAAISIVVWSGLIAHGFITQSSVGVFQMTASAGGLNFVEGKCPIKDNADSVGYSWLSPLYHHLGKHEKKYWDRPFTDSGYFLAEGLACVRDNPLVLLQSLESIPFLFVGNWMWPAGNLAFADWLRIYEMVFAFFSIGGLGAFAVLATRRTVTAADLLTWVVPLLGLITCVYIFKSEIRFRIPFDVWIIPLAAKGWVDLWALRALHSSSATGGELRAGSGGPQT